ncbi:hypothetical protein [Nocardioides sp. InS609-2]|uniref:hypothetical protein n=1 Tax=Nocardioides sp. InS609-2 TaxID=2760705 RepID=UPI0020BD94E1|nr:hypothetical protein [Nocardioides sp. InS609-2]
MGQCRVEVTIEVCPAIGALVSEPSVELDDGASDDVLDIAEMEDCLLEADTRRAEAHLRTL